MEKINIDDITLTENNIFQNISRLFSTFASNPNQSFRKFEQSCTK